jgi:hypothetical protein
VSGLALRYRAGAIPVCFLNTVLKKLLLEKPVCNAICVMLNEVD